MNDMFDPMLAARGILTLISQTVDEEDLTLAHESLDYGYPRSAVYFGVAAARQAEAPLQRTFANSSFMNSLGQKQNSKMSWTYSNTSRSKRHK